MNVFKKWEDSSQELKKWWKTPMENFSLTDNYSWTALKIKILCFLQNYQRKMTNHTNKNIYILKLLLVIFMIGIENHHDEIKLFNRFILLKKYTTYRLVHRKIDDWNIELNIKLIRVQARWKGIFRSHFEKKWSTKKLFFTIIWTCLVQNS